MSSVPNTASRFAALVLGLVLGLGCLSLHAEAEQGPEALAVGYLVNLGPTPGKEAADPEFEATARVLRADRELEASNGFPLLEGDVVITGAHSTAAVAFADESAVTLYDESRLRIRAYAYPAQRQPTLVELEKGGAYFDIKKRPADARFRIDSAAGRVEVKGTVFEILLIFTAGQWAAEVLVRSGVVNVAGNDITSDGQTLSLVNLAGGITAPVNLSSINVFERFARRRRATLIATVTTDTQGNITIKGGGTGPDGENHRFLIKENTVKKSYSETINVTSADHEKTKIINKRTFKASTGVTTHTGSNKTVATEGKDTISETRLVAQDGSTLVGGKYTRTITGMGATLKFTGKFTATGSGDALEITGTLTGSSGGTITGNFRLTREVAGDGTVTELLFLPNSGNLPAVQRTVRNPDGSVAITFLDGSNQTTGGNVVDGPFTTIGFAANVPGIQLPSGVVIRPGQEGRSSP